MSNKYFDYLKNWIDYNSDYGSNVKFRVPEQYFNVPIHLRDYKINHIPDRDSALKFINDVIKVFPEDNDLKLVKSGFNVI